MSCNLLYDNLRKDNFLPRDTIIYHISSVGRALKSFFPQEGIFNQLISSDLIKRIESDELKTRLFKLFNEDLRRHDVHTKEYDNFFLKFNYSLSEKFFLEHNWSIDYKDKNQIKIINYRFNAKYYESDEFFGNLIHSKENITSYLVELKELKSKYKELKKLCINEIN
jgi:hypothetical protein